MESIPRQDINPDKISTLNQQQLIPKGYMQLANDWKNVEMTGYFKINSFTDSIHNGPPHIELLARGGIHTSIVFLAKGHHIIQIYTKLEEASLKKSGIHCGIYNRRSRETLCRNSLQGKWIGIKAIFYNKNDGTVNLEQWIDDGFDSTIYLEIIGIKSLNLQTLEIGELFKMIVVALLIQ